jgi:hypothetical protein
MNADPSINVVVFEIAIDGRLEKLIRDGPTRSANCVQLIWQALEEEYATHTRAVRRLYSEWDPSDEDKAFIRATFPAEVEVTYSFARPADNDWDRAMREVAATIEEVGEKQNARPPRRSWWQFWK